MTRVPERWDASWEHNRALAVMADAAGIEFLPPIARWIGYGGETEFQNNTLETIYVDEFPFFRDEVLPRLEAKGLRQKAKPL